MSRRLAKLGQIFKSPLDRLNPDVVKIADPWVFAADPIDTGPNPTPVGRVKVWNGSSWVARNLKFFNGSYFDVRQPKFWNGSIWVPYSASQPEELLMDETPASSETSDNTNVTLGMIFRVDVNGQVKAANVYRGAANTQPNISIGLWEITDYNTGSLLASRTGLTIAAGPGWTRLDFTSPINVTAGKHYLIAYFKAQNGNSPYYYYTSGKFSSAGKDSASGNLYAISNTEDAGYSSQPRNGRYEYGSSLQFPTAAFGAAWYGVDVVFQPS